MNESSTSLQLLNLAALWLVIPGVILVIKGIPWLYRKELTNQQPAGAKFMLAMRVALILVMLAALLQPALKIVESKALKPALLLLIDGSQSMNVPDKQASVSAKLRLAVAAGLIEPTLLTRRVEESANKMSELDLGFREGQQALGRLQQNVELKKVWDNACQQDLEKLSNHLQKVQDTATKVKQEVDALLESQAQPPAPKEKAKPAKKKKGKKPTDETPSTLPRLAEALKELIELDLARFAKAEGDVRLRRAAATRKQFEHLGVETASCRARVANIARGLEAYQEHLDESLVARQDKRVGEALKKLDEMKRTDLVARILAGEGRHDVRTDLQERFRVLPYIIKDKTVPLPGWQGKKPLKIVATGTKTDLPADVLEMLETVSTGKEDEPESGVAVRGIMLVSDGQHNGYSDPNELAAVLAARNVPLYSVGVGSPRPPLDIVLSDLKASETVFHEDNIKIDAVVRNTFPASRDPKAKERVVELRVIDDDKDEEEILDTQTLTFVPGEVAKTAHFSIKAEEIGRKRLKVTIPPLEGEVVTTNNTRRCSVNVVKEKTRVLLLDGRPRWEFRYIKNLYQRDKKIDMTHLVFSNFSTGEFPRGENGKLKTEDGEDKGKPSLPKDKDGWLLYDLIVLGDLPRDALKPEELEHIRTFVADRGGTLFLIAGRFNFPAGYRETALEKLLPVETDPMAEIVSSGNSKEGFQLALTEDGLAFPPALFERDEDETRRIWQRLPSHFWFFPVVKAIPGAVPIVESDDDRNIPLIVTHYYGLGKVLYMGMDSTWRWRFEIGDEYHHDFWGQALLWATSGRLTGESEFVKLGTSRPTYASGDRVEVAARVLDPDKKPMEEGLVSAIATPLVSQAGKPADSVDVQMKPIPNSGGLYRGVISGLPDGNYELRIKAANLNEDQCNSRGLFRIEPESNIEEQELNLNDEFLKDLSRRTSGKYEPLSRLAELTRIIPSREEVIRTEEDVELWNSWYVLGLLAALATLEWIQRKRNGMF